MRTILAASVALAILIGAPAAVGQDAPAAEGQDAPAGYYAARDYIATSADQQIGYTTGLMDAVRLMLWAFDEYELADEIAVCIEGVPPSLLSVLYDTFLENLTEDELNLPGAALFIEMIGVICFGDELDAPAGGGVLQLSPSP